VKKWRNEYVFLQELSIYKEKSFYETHLSLLHLFPNPTNHQFRFLFCIHCGQPPLAHPTILKSWTNPWVLYTFPIPYSTIIHLPHTSFHLPYLPTTFSWVSCSKPRYPVITIGNSVATTGNPVATYFRLFWVEMMIISYGKPSTWPPFPSMPLLTNFLIPSSPTKGQVV